MAKVPLRKYNSEIEALIDRGQTDESIAHCRHILKTFPKHLGTYRLLGKAYLETKRYAEATDIFKRVLMAVPDDFVAHVGMSIIADDQKRLDDAIWHMERAFEAQPSNAAIQGELQRLYGRRDGMEPSKIRLTRGALAHMYVQGELYAQAIGEIRSVLAEDPNRTDMQVLLTLAYFRGGYKVEASEVCSQLIGRFPYCLDANRVLMEILPGTGLAESIQTYRQRVVELDPYAAYTAGSIFLTNETQDSAVNLDRLEYKGQPVGASTEWGDALGISLGASAASASKMEPVPPSSQPFDFPKADAVAQDKPFDFPKADAFAQDKPEPAAPAPGGDALPEWMRDAGWGASTGTFDESAASLDDGVAADDLPKADLPDWIKSMAPSETRIPPKPMPAASDDTMDWLNKLGGDNPFGSDSRSTPAEQDSPIADQPQETPAIAADIPDWFSDLGNDQPLDFASRSTPTEQEKPLDATLQEVPASASDELASWLSKLDEEEKPFDFASQSTPVGQDKPFDFAQDKPFDFPKADAVAQDKFFAEPAQEIPPVVAPPASLGSSIGNLGTSAAEQDSAMLWLESLAAKQGAKSEELITNPAERLDKPPEWVEQAKAAGESQPAAYVPEAASPDSDELAKWLSKLDEEEKPFDFASRSTPVGQDKPFDFAQDKPPALPEDGGKPVQVDAIDFGAFSRAVTEPAQETPPVVAPPVEPAPAGLGSSIGNLGTSAAEQDSAMLWLESLAAKQGAKSEELITRPEDRLDKPPEWVEQAKVAGESQPVAFEPSAIDQTGVWLRELDEKDERAEVAAEAQSPDWSAEIKFVPPPPAVPAARSAAEADLPTWLRGLEEREAAPASPISDKMPEWLRGDEPEVPAPPEPTRPADWMPEASKEVAPPIVPEPKPEPRKEVRKPQPKPEAPPPPDKTKVRRTGMLPPLIDPNLALARDAMAHGKIPDALQAYGGLIRKGKLLEDITFDLKEALYRFPVEVSIWQALGDAYMRANRLQDALDAYTKAEELLR